jgi:hypothetical protein
MATGLTISRAAERAGVGVETIRFYERAWANQTAAAAAEWWLSLLRR